MEKLIIGCIGMPHQLQQSFNFELNERIIASREMKSSEHGVTLARLDKSPRVSWIGLCKSVGNLSENIMCPERIFL
jgi:hypothetical protein